jgi:hypothetical protein
MDNELEALVDKHGLYGVVHALERICYGKAEHLASNWQDHDASRRWERAGKKFDALFAQLQKIQVE